MFCHPASSPMAAEKPTSLDTVSPRVAASGFPQQRMGPVMLVVKDTNELLQQEDVS